MAVFSMPNFLGLDRWQVFCEHAGVFVAEVILEIDRHFGAVLQDVRFDQFPHIGGRGLSHVLRTWSVSINWRDRRDRIYHRRGRDGDTGNQQGHRRHA